MYAKSVKHLCLTVSVFLFLQLLQAQNSNSVGVVLYTSRQFSSCVTKECP